MSAANHRLRGGASGVAQGHLNERESVTFSQSTDVVGQVLSSPWVAKLDNVTSGPPVEVRQPRDGRALYLLSRSRTGMTEDEKAEKNHPPLSSDPHVHN